MFKVTMYRHIGYNRHNYCIGEFPSIQTAFEEGLKEREFRGNKYEFEIYENNKIVISPNYNITTNNIDDYINATKKLKFYNILKIKMLKVLNKLLGVLGIERD